MNEIGTYIGWSGCVVLLILFSIQDIRKKKIDLRFVLLLLPFAAAQWIFPTDITIPDRMAGMLIGAFFLALSKLSKEKIGTGDGWVILCLGAMLGGYQSVQMLFYTFLCLMAAAVILVLIFRVPKNHTVPFIPFLLCGFLFCCVWD